VARKGTRSAPTAVLVDPVVLAVAAGFVDAVGFLHLFGVFPANQSGNAVFLGMAFADAAPAPGWKPLLAITGFAVGAFVGVSLAARLPVDRRRRVLLAVEVAMMTVLTIAVAAVHDDGELLEGPAAVALLVAAPVTMGLQTEVIRRTAGIAVTTTYQSGGVARIGEAVAGGLGLAGRGPRGARRLFLLVAVVLAYVAGAALGSTGLGDGRLSLLPPTMVLAGLLAVWVVAPAAAGAGEEPLPG
jgi:uncharacterized membrane protein YoaK (UPF0700 family)